jgi:hypothetical protein
VPFGKYWRSRRFVFSFVPRCHGLCGSQRKLREEEFGGIQVVAINVKCLEADSSDPAVCSARLGGTKMAPPSPGSGSGRGLLGAAVPG